MSVAFTLAWAAEARALGATVTFEPGWETRGNGTSSAYEGGEVHHTGFGSSLANPFPAKGTLINGRPDLSGPLCNVAGVACTPDRPTLHVIAAHPANHAGASGGKSMGPLPVTGLFNRRVFGLEIDYGGNVPMLPGQYAAAVIFGAAVTRVLKRPSAEWIRAHAETSITGKWDPGFAPGKTIDMAQYRRDVWNRAVNVGGISMADIDSLQAGITEVVEELRGKARTGWPMRLHHIKDEKQWPRPTVVGALADVFTELRSQLSVDQAPKGNLATLFGHVLAIRSEARVNHDRTITALGDIATRLTQLRDTVAELGRPDLTGMQFPQVDVLALAKAVNDDAAARLAS